MSDPVKPTNDVKRAWRRRAQEGITPRHQRNCGSRDGRTCSCTLSYQAQVYSPRDRTHIRKTFATLATARAWRQESQIALRKGKLRGPCSLTLSEAAKEWLTAARAGLIRTRSGDPYKPAAVRAYRQSLNHHVLPTLGSKRLTAITGRWCKTSPTSN